MDVIGGDKREGLGRKAPPQFLLTLLAFVSGILLFSSLYGAEASVFKKAREQVLDAAAPVLSVFAGPIAVVNDVAGQVSDYFRALEENKALREENAELRLWMREALELRRTLRAYEGLKIYNAPPEARPINAFVIGEANDALTRSMIVNAGRVRGVRSDLAVVDEKGLIGRTVEVGADAARVLLLTDGRSRVPVVIEGADTQGLLVGRADGRPVIDITATGEVDAIAPGQRVVTSGAGGAMPPGLPIG
ncbi:MAG: rod shape-determining protein MreC, partial [Pseudomonadota bacterium]